MSLMSTTRPKSGWWWLPVQVSGVTEGWGSTGVLPFTAIPIPAGKSNFSDSAEPEMPEWSFQRFPANTSAYLTLGTMQYHYRCLEPNGELTVLRVGSETSCAHDASVPNCNGPLPGPGPYWWVVRNNFFSEMAVMQCHGCQGGGLNVPGGVKSCRDVALRSGLDSGI